MLAVFFFGLIFLYEPVINVGGRSRELAVQCDRPTGPKQQQMASTRSTYLQICSALILAKTSARDVIFGIISKSREARKCIELQPLNSPTLQLNASSSITNSITSHASLIERILASKPHLPDWIVVICSVVAVNFLCLHPLTSVRHRTWS